MILSVLSQKGGVAKSTTARALAVAFSSNKWNVHIADMDWQQQSSCKWSERRCNNLSNITASSHRRVDDALSLSKLFDALIVDGRPASDLDSIVIAKSSNKIILPTGASLDDLEPQLNLANDFISNGVSPESIIFIINKATTKTESNKAIETIKAWGFPVCDQVIPFKAGYSIAQDSGLSITETRYHSLNSLSNIAIQQLVNEIMKS